jgi:uncharacterized protein YecE (DUF72 family)
MTLKPGLRIRVGVGGWTYDGWRASFYPEDLPHKRELEFASRKLSSIEINGTYYRTQTPESFAKWYAETPHDFVFAVKGPRYATNRRVLAESGKYIELFFNSGVMELKEKLGPINWQFMPSKTFEPDDLERFLRLLPKSVAGRPVRHALEVRHSSFGSPAFTELAEAHGIAVVIAGDSDYPQIADQTAPFVYARIMGTDEGEECGYPSAMLDLWAERARTWKRGEIPERLETVTRRAADRNSRDVFMYVIGGCKARNPAAALAIIERVKRGQEQAARCRS